MLVFFYLSLHYCSQPLPVSPKIKFKTTTYCQIIKILTLTLTLTWIQDRKKKKKNKQTDRPTDLWLSWCDVPGGARSFLGSILHHLCNFQAHHSQTPNQWFSPFAADAICICCFFLCVYLQQNSLSQNLMRLV